MNTKIDGILLDIDNTIYSYDEANKYALEQVYHYLHCHFHFEKAIIHNEFQKARHKVNLTLNTTASSHNRLLYFQLLCEKLDIDALTHSLILYNIYWDSYLMKIELFEDAEEFIKEFSSKICFVTDLTAHIQHRKLLKLGLSNLGCKIVTSEEVGVEKPHPYIFKVALDKLNVNPSNACMVGDNYEKDIQGAILSGIIPILKLNHKEQVVLNQFSVTTISNFCELKVLLCKN